MAYNKDRFGITSICPGRINALDINWDSNDTLNNEPYPKHKRYPVFLFTPDMNRNTIEHHHIELNRAQTKRLHKWLGDFLKDTHGRTTQKKKKT